MLMHRWAVPFLTDASSCLLNGCDSVRFSSVADWLSIFRARIDGVRFRRPSETDVAQLSAGRSWIVQPESMCFFNKGHSDLRREHNFFCPCCYTEKLFSYPSGYFPLSSGSCSFVLAQRDHTVDDGYETLRKPDLNTLTVAHELPVDINLSAENLRKSISHHVGTRLWFVLVTNI